MDGSQTLYMDWEGGKFNFLTSKFNQVPVIHLLAKLSDVLSVHEEAYLYTSVFY
jgi:hypothetical protein